MIGCARGLSLFDFFSLDTCSYAFCFYDYKNDVFMPYSDTKFSLIPCPHAQAFFLLSLLKINLMYSSRIFYGQFNNLSSLAHLEVLKSTLLGLQLHSYFYPLKRHANNVSKF